jgi:predicted nucleic acid-binding Zn ribbon protein
VLSRNVLRKMRREARGAGPVEEAWKAVVPERFSTSTRVCGWRRRDLTIAVDGSAALSELASFYRQDLLEALNARLAEEGVPTVRSIRFVLEEEIAGQG